MPIEMAIPFALAADGSIAVEAVPDRQISSRVRALVGTQPGERWMRPDFGVPLLDYVFEEDDAIAEAQLGADVQRVLSAYEPGAKVRQVRPVLSDSGDGIARVEVDFVRTEAASSAGSISKQVNTAVIRVGGTVSEVIRG